MNTGTSRYVINVVTRDQVGIIANVSDALFRLGGNLEALSQTVVWGWFTMIVCGEFPRRVSAKEIKEAVESSGDYRAIVLPHDGLREGKPWKASRLSLGEAKTSPVSCAADPLFFAEGHKHRRRLV